jgi:hypothetical protein
MVRTRAGTAKQTRGIPRSVPSSGQRLVCPKPKEATDRGASAGASGIPQKAAPVSRVAYITGMPARWSGDPRGPDSYRTKFLLV